MSSVAELGCGWDGLVCGVTVHRSEKESTEKLQLSIFHAWGCKRRVARGIWFSTADFNFIASTQRWLQMAVKRHSSGK